MQLRARVKPQPAQSVAKYTGRKKHPRVKNTSGLPCLPVELINLILSFYPTIPIPYTEPLSELPADNLYRFWTLLALSQTSSRLRTIVRPLTWERVEVWRHLPRARKGAGPRDAIEKEMALDLLQRIWIFTMKGQIAKTALASIRYVNVMLGTFDPTAVIADFTEFLDSLPNLEALQLLDVPSPYSWHMALPVFHNQCCHTVHTLSIPWSVSYDLLESGAFPNLQSLTLIDSRRRVDFVQRPNMQIHETKCPISQLETRYHTLEHFSIPPCYDWTQLSVFAKKFDKLQVLPFKFDLRPYAQLPSARPPGDEWYEFERDFQDAVSLVQNIGQLSDIPDLRHVEFLLGRKEDLEAHHVLNIVQSGRKMLAAVARAAPHPSAVRRLQLTFDNDEPHLITIGG